MTMSNMQADVIVIAAGAAGLAAAVAAAQSGAKVIAFEKGATTGGAASMGMGPFGVESRLQKLKQMGPSRDEAFRIFMDHTHWRVDAQLVRTYIDKAATTIEWLENLGVEFLEPAAYFPGGAFTWHLVKPPMGGQPGPMIASAMTKTLTERAKELGVQIMLQMAVKKILKQAHGITGVIAEDRSGNETEASAKAVIIATGGFGDNPEMIKKYTGYEWGKDMWSLRVPGLTGDGIRMAWEVGAAPTEMNMEMIYMMPGVVNPVLSMAFQQPHLMVNLLGERFLDEGIMYNTTFTGNAIARQKNRCAFLIFDDAIKGHMETAGFDHTSVVFPFLKATNIDVLIKEAIDTGYQDVFVADSVEEMAVRTGVDPEGLKRTVEQYNRFCDTGYDPVFNKKHHLLRPIRTPKFYAARLFPSAYGSLGGIKINHRAEVLSKDWKKIPGLYAAGTDACTIYGDSYVFILPGNTMGFAINTGRIAGENAAEYAKSFG
jgi:fumarate reductase flavoprotein subunit